MNEKRCFKCIETKPLDQFYKHPMMKDGRLGKCIECTKRDVRERYALMRDQRLAYERGRTPTPKRRAQIVASIRRYPDKQRARVALRNAIVRGKLEKRPCNVCGDPKSEAHHTDYSKPLEVTWLCRKHHAEEHMKLRESAA